MVRIVVLVAVGLLAVSTLDAAWGSVYGSVWFVGAGVAVWLTLAVVLVQRRLWRNLPLLVLHVSLLLILAGGFLTWLTANSGTLRLSPQTETNQLITKNGMMVALPFSVRLDSLVVDYYPGRELPRDFNSYITIDGSEHHRVSMNRIANIGGYRLYQASYDSNGGSVLTVSYDPWGIGVTYAGYLLFAIGGIGCMVAKHGRFRSLLRAGGRTAAVVVTMMVGSTASAVDGISAEQAAELESVQVIYKGRVVPYYTVAREFAVKVTGETCPGGLSPVRFMASIVAFPDAWDHVDFILVKDRGLRARLEMDGKYISRAGLFAADGSYRLAGLYRGGTSGDDRAVLDTDEKVEMLLMLRQGTLYSAVDDQAVLWHPGLVKLEIWYYKCSLGRWLFMAAFVVAMVSVVGAALRRNVWWLGIPLLVVWVANYAARWIIAGRIPLASGGEVMEFVAIFVLFMAVMAGRRSASVFASGVFMGAFAGLVSWLSDSNPTITALMPVLASPWLSAHVATIMASYAILAFTFPIALAGLVVPSLCRECMRRIELLTIAGVILLGIGIILGAMWANVSWGRYWAWDPKETWALITMMLYAMPLHRACRCRRASHSFIYYLVIFLSIPMTYYGVNFLTSLHAYA